MNNAKYLAVHIGNNQIGDHVQRSIARAIVRLALPTAVIAAGIAWGLGL